ncbi:MAG TPA: hypothetical protein EYP85_02185 [Armatimonadetes bacterium]|nr:hypothetical protein [Armatimonadota bacterium]
MAVTWRAVLLGLLLIPPNSYWVMKVEGVWHSGHPSAMSLFWNVVFTLFILLIINLGLKRFLPRYALTQGEFITVYVMLNMATALAGHDSLQLGIPAMSLSFWLANESNRWDQIMNHLLPDWLTVSEEKYIKPFYEGHSSLYVDGHWTGWVAPVLWWVAFILALGLVLICLNVIVRKQWTENERLSYPIIQLPMAMTEEGGSPVFFKNRLLWVGIALGAGLDILNGIHTLYPVVPGFAVRHNQRVLSRYFVTYPWNQIGAFWLPLYPFIIAMGFFLPLDLSFSIWFFYLFGKAQRIVFALFSTTASVNQYLNAQSFGAWFAIFLYTAYLGRRHFAAVARKILWGTAEVDDREEPMRYRTAALGLLAGFGFIYWFCLRASMTPLYILGFFTVYFVLAIAITRVHAELGPPAHEMAGGMNSTNFFVITLGTEAVGPRNLALHPLFYWFTGRGYRTQVMPPMLDGLKMAERAHVSPRGLGWAMLLGVLFGAIAAYWAAIHLYYQEGANAMDAHNRGQFYQLASWLENPRDPDTISMGFLAGGLIFTFVMMFIRLHSLRWPFHPAGYALSMNFGVDYFWSCLVISWLLKALVLRYGGYRFYRRLLPLMYGVIIGEYCVGAFWSAWSVIAGYRTYDFCPG